MALTVSDMEVYLYLSTCCIVPHILTLHQMLVSEQSTFNWSLHHAITSITCHSCAFNQSYSTQTWAL